MSDTTGKTETADEQARRMREIGDGTAVYGEVGQNDEQLDVHQPDDDEEDT